MSVAIVSVLSGASRSAFMLVSQLFKVAQLWLLRMSAGTLYCQTGPWFEIFLGKCQSGTTIHSINSIAIAFWRVRLSILLFMKIRTNFWGKFKLYRHQVNLMSLEVECHTVSHLKALTRGIEHASGHVHSSTFTLQNNSLSIWMLFC